MPSIRIATLAAVLGCGLWAAGAQAACYVVYDAQQQVVYRGQTPPVDLSFPLHETLPALATGATMVFSLDNDGCALEVNRLAQAAAAPHRRAAAPAARR